MSSRRNHAARSRKTHRYNLYAARSALRGSLPYEIRKMFLRLGRKPAEQEPVEEEAAQE